MTLMRSYALSVVAVFAGCSDPPPPTDVVVVLQSDLAVPADTDGVHFSAIAGSSAPDPSGFLGSSASAPLSCFAGV